ncbi:hypothetical protein AB4Y72_15065 [Arthrobacter sp. YAF34]|uniref:hypothetical protein n=1 Tax=Arthrobacter sp. YAF34 TaxID=3233083 RepID=UPI003F93A241
MGFFSKDNSGTAFADPGQVAVDPDVAQTLPDPVEVLLAAYPEPAATEAAVEYRRVRHPHGGYPSGLRRGLPLKPSAGPLYLLNWLTAGDEITVQVWATNGLRFGAKSGVEQTVGTLCSTQGIPAAATWVLSQRGSDVLPVDFLAGQLADYYEERASSITNGMVIDSIRKWKR